MRSKLNRFLAVLGVAGLLALPAAPALAEDPVSIPSGQNIVDSANVLGGRKAEVQDAIHKAATATRWGVRDEMLIAGCAMLTDEQAEFVLAAAEAFWSLEAPIGRVAAYDTPYPIASVEELYVPSVERVLAGIRQVMESAP